MNELHRLQRVWSGRTNVLPYTILKVQPPGNAHELARVTLFTPQDGNAHAGTDLRRLYTFYRCGFATLDDPECGFMIERYDDWTSGFGAMVGYAKEQIRELRKIYARSA